MRKLYREAARLVIGSFIVYVVVAACSAGGPPKAWRLFDGPSSDAGGIPHVSRWNGGQDAASYGGAMDPVMESIAKPVNEAKAEPVNGSRLKAIYRVAQDGSKEPVAGRWWDSQREEECSWQLASDGVSRCLPTDVAPGASVMFSDAACTQDAVIVPRAYCEGQTPPRYATGYVPECAAGIKVRFLELGVPSAAVYNRSATGECIDLTSSFSPSYSIYRATQVAPAAFVGSALQHE